MTEPSRDAARGLGLVLLSTVAFGVLPILGKAAYAAGVRVLPFLAWRYLVATLLFAVLLGRRRPPWRTRLRLWAIGFVFVFNSVAYFLALARAPASTVSLLLFSYPVIVALLAAAAGLERLTLRNLLAAVAAFAGCARPRPGGGGAALTEAKAGAALALLAALIYASYVVLVVRFARDVPAAVLAQHLTQTSVVVCGAIALATGGLAVPATGGAWLPVLGAGVLCTVVAFFAFLAGMALVGPTRASVVQLVRGRGDAGPGLRPARGAARRPPVDGSRAHHGRRPLAERGGAAARPGPARRAAVSAGAPDPGRG